MVGLSAEIVETRLDGEMVKLESIFGSSVCVVNGRLDGKVNGLIDCPTMSEFVVRIDVETVGLMVTLSIDSEEGRLG